MAQMDHLQTNMSSLETYAGSLSMSSLIQVALLTALACVVVSVIFPRVGFRAAYEPRWLVGLRFYLGASSMIDEGYRKVTYRTSSVTT